jgi:hypothetical protein
MVGYSDVATLVLKPKNDGQSLELILILSIFVSPRFRVKASEKFMILCLYLSMYICQPARLSVYVSIYVFIYSCCSHLEQGQPWNASFFYSFLISDGRTPCTENQPDARPLPTQDNTNRINADIHASSGIQTQNPSVRAGQRQFMP